MTSTSETSVYNRIRALGPFSVLVVGLLLLGAASASAAGWGLGERGSLPDWERGEALSSLVARASVSDPTGDTFGSGPAQLDLTGLSAEVSGQNLVVRLTFNGMIEAPSSDEPNEVNGFIDLDTDQNAATGTIPWTDFETGSDSTGMGNEFYVDLFSFSPVDQAADLFSEVAQEVVGRAPVEVEDAALTVTIPLAWINDDGAVNVAAVIGTPDEPTDKAPNEGAVASEAGDAEVFTLNNDRFAVMVSWREFTGNTGPGKVVVRSDDSAVLYFFTENNWEMLIKVLNGCPVNNNFWVFFAATTNVEFTVTVTDLESGQVKQYTNPLGQSADAVTDTSAFATCP